MLILILVCPLEIICLSSRPRFQANNTFLLLFFEFGCYPEANRETQRGFKILILDVHLERSLAVGLCCNGSNQPL